MKISSDVVIRHIAGETVMIPTGKAAMQNSGILSLTESGELLVRKLQKECEFNDLVDSLLAEYEVTREQAEQDIQSFLNQLKERSLL